MKSPSIGARARRLVLERPIETPDGFGGVIRTFQAGPQVWGAIEAVSADERGLRRFDIRSAVDPDGRRRDLVCLVEEVTP